MDKKDKLITMLIVLLVVILTLSVVIIKDTISDSNRYRTAISTIGEEYCESIGQEYWYYNLDYNEVKCRSGG